MFRYYFGIGLANLRRSPALTTLMVVTLAVGVAASVSTLTILRVMSGNPIPHKSDRLLVPMPDNGPGPGFVPGMPPGDNQVTYRDALAFLAAPPGIRRTAVFDIVGVVEDPRATVRVEQVNGLAVTADFFPMFEVPFRHGGPWTAADDRAKARLVVLSRAQSEKRFGTENPVGRDLTLLGQTFRVAGVLDSWMPLPRYTHLINGNGGSFNGEDELYIPMATAIDLQLRNNGSTSCHYESQPGYQNFLDSECTWIQPWIEVASAADRGRVREWLDGYVAEQRRLGRLPRAVPARLFDVMEWMEYLKVVKNDTRLAVWLSFGFLLLCLINTVGLLLAKFSVRAAEVGVRRALGATKGAIFRQFLVEAGVVGLAGGTLGLVLAIACLAFITQQMGVLSIRATLDWPLLVLTFVLALCASLLAGLLPTWRACQVTPALQLKSQ